MSTREFLVSMWPVHPAAVLGACALAFVYVWRWRVSGRSNLQRAGFLSVAIVLFLLILDSPLEALSNGYLFSAHMLQHLLLQLVVPPFLLWAWTSTELRAPAEPKSANEQGAWHRAARVLTKPFPSWLAGVGGMWFWHVPTLCNAATSNPVVRTMQVVSLLTLGTLFWMPIIGPDPRKHLPSLMGIMYLFTACVGCTLLGIIITFAPVSVCSIYVHPVDRLGILPLIQNGWGLTPAVDQQIGGLLMWVPACFIYLCGIIGLLARWYGEAGERVRTNVRPQTHAA